MTSPANATIAFDQYSLVGDLASRVRRMIQRIFLPLLALLAAAAGRLIHVDSPGLSCFVLVAIGTLLVLGIWRQSGIGLPLVPVIAIQHLFTYGMPIVIGNSSVNALLPEYGTEAGIEVLVFSASLAMAWSLAMQVFSLSRAECYALPDFQRRGSERLKSIGLKLVAIGVAYQALSRAGLLGLFFALLPSGLDSLIGPLMTGMSACGFFLVALFVGSGDINRSQRLLFWSLLVVSTALSASTFLMSAATTVIAAVLIGLFWSTGRIPWRYLVTVIALLSFFSVGKFTMRERYWQFGEEYASKEATFMGIPATYLEWCEASFDALTTPPSSTENYLSDPTEVENHQTIFDRINNLQNLLFVIDAVKGRRIPPMGGETYALIPPLLLPRIIWPGKPRAHEGQVRLNVHFGRQDLGSTLTTYIAWGLLAEAYGNFGPYAGAIILGAVMGGIFAWLENLTARKLLLSLEGFVSFVILLGFANSFEMVASVLVTMVFQAIMPIIFAMLPFLRRMTVQRPDPTST